LQDRNEKVRSRRDEETRNAQDSSTIASASSSLSVVALAKQGTSQEFCLMFLEKLAKLSAGGCCSIRSATSKAAARNRSHVRAEGLNPTWKRHQQQQQKVIEKSVPFVQRLVLIVRKRE